MRRRHRHHKHRKRHNHKSRNLKRRHKRGIRLTRSQKHIFQGIASFIIGILIIRFSTEIFTDLFNWTEGVFWGWLFGGIFILLGIFSIIAWWRNNVSMFTTRHSVKWN